MAARFDDSSAFTDRYHIEREVGSGGMARVFLARDLKHDREVAIKVLRPELSSGIGKERFLREIKLAARLMHPNILQLFDSGEDDGALYFVMPYVKGASLRVRLEREGQLPLADALEITRDIAGALDYAHRQDIVHRDIKPENIMIHDGVAMVTDFGIGKALRAAGAEALTQAGALLGTPAYMSPEQVAGETTLDGRSDIYSLGATWYRMIVGRVPFMGNSPMEVMRQHVEAPLKWPAAAKANIPSAITVTIQRMMSKKPETHIQSMHLRINIIREKCLGDRSIFEQLGIERGKKKVAAMWELKFTQGDTVKEVRLPEERLADLLRKGRIPRDTLVRVAYEGGEYSPIKDAPQLQPYLVRTAPPVMSKGADKGRSARSDRPKRDAKQRAAPPVGARLREFVAGYDDHVAEHERKKRRKKLVVTLVRVVIVAAVLAALGYAGYKYLPALTGGQDAAPAAEYDE